MMIRKYAILILLYCLAGAASPVFSQYNIPENRIWMMANHTGLTFTGGQPVPLSSPVRNTECSAVVCDSTGNLRFTTDGYKIWDRQGNVMPNGLNINNTDTSNYTTTQGALIVPDPGNVNRYYVFSLYRYAYVNVVDMTLNSGMGDVVTTYPLRGKINNDTMGEKMVAIRGCNNNIWVVIRANTTRSFYAYQVKSTGLDIAPVISTAGRLPPGHYYQGQMAASQDGKLLATASGLNAATSLLELFRFDNASGMIYHSEVLDSAIFSYGLAFSPDATKLYYSNSTNNFRVVQYDLLDSIKTDLGPGRVTQFKLGMDGKVYFISPVSFSTDTGISYLGRIGQPNQPGNACQFEEFVPTLSFANNIYNGLLVGLPTEVVKAKASESTPANRVIRDTVFCAAEPFAPIPLQAYSVFSNYVWDNGTTGLSRSVTQSGNYWVRYNTLCGQRTDTFKIHARTIPPLQLQYNAPVVSTTQSYSSYQWYKDGQLLAGQTSAALTVTGAGWYSLKVGWLNACTDSAALYVQDPNSIADMQTAELIKVYPNPVKDQVTVQTEKKVHLMLIDINGKVRKDIGGKTMPMADLEAGIYFLHITDARSGTLLKVHKITKQ